VKLIFWILGLQTLTSKENRRYREYGIVVSEAAWS